MTDAPTALPPVELEFVDGLPTSRAFADVYHSRAGAAAEKQHVFVDGAGLAGRFASARRVATVAELGFGAGFNLLQTWRCWKRHARPGARLRYIAWELHPLSGQQLREIHAAEPQLEPLARQLRARLPLRWPGWHRVRLADDVELVLAYEDAGGIADARFGADAWFLDGFSPRRNPRMWEAGILAQVYRLTKPGGVAATYAVGSALHADLAATGFRVGREAGFATKRHMTLAHRDNDGEQPAAGQAAAGPVAVIGAGIAGASVAAALKNRGVDVQVIEAGPAAPGGASGNPQVMLAPRPLVGDQPRGLLLNEAFSHAAALLDELGASRTSGALLLAHSAHEVRRQRTMLGMDWPADMVQVVDRRRAGEIAGLKLDTGGVWMPQARQASGAEVVRMLLDGVEVRAGCQVVALDGNQTGGATVRMADGSQTSYAAVVVACGAQVDRLVPQLDGLVSRPGSLELVAATQASRRLRLPLLYGGVLGTAGDSGAHLRTGRARLPGSLASLFDEACARPAWSGVRSSARDRLPVAGRLDGGLYALCALGSRGFSLAPLLAQLVAGEIAGEAPLLPGRVVDAVRPAQRRLAGAGASR